MATFSGTTPTGESFEIEHEVDHDFNLGDTVSYRGVTYVIDRRTVDIPDGRISYGLSVPITPAPEPGPCPVTAMIGGAIKRCIEPRGHLGPHQFPP